MSSSPEKTHLGLVVEIGSLRCAFRLSEISEVLRPLPIEPLPSPIDAILGVTVLRGATVPVIDPARLLGLTASPPNRFVVVRVGERRAALAVQRIHGVQDLTELPFEALPPLLRDLESEAIQAVGRLDHELLLVLSSARLVEGPLSEQARASA